MISVHPSSVSEAAGSAIFLARRLRHWVVGSVDMHEVQGSMGDRRATVTTPWGRYCMRERRAAGPYDARRDRGMDSMTCPDG